MELWLEMMPPFARFIYYLGAVGFLTVIGIAVYKGLGIIDPMPEDWWNEDGE